MTRGGKWALSGPDTSIPLKRRGLRLVGGHVVAERQHIVGKIGGRCGIEDRRHTVRPRDLEAPSRGLQRLLQLGHEDPCPGDLAFLPVDIPSGEMVDATPGLMMIALSPVAIRR